MRWILKLYHKYKCFTQQHNFVTESVPTNNPLAVNIQAKCVNCNYKIVTGKQYFFD
jgi:hypothetical protein